MYSCMNTFYTEVINNKNMHTVICTRANGKKMK